MRNRVARLLAATLAYGLAIILVADLGTPALDAVAAGAAAVWHSLTGAVRAGLVAATDPTVDVEVIVGVAVPLTLLALGSIARLIVWPLTIDHAHTTDAAPATPTAEVTVLPARQPAGAGRRAA